MSERTEWSRIHAINWYCRCTLLSDRTLLSLTGDGLNEELKDAKRHCTAQRWTIILCCSYYERPLSHPSSHVNHSLNNYWGYFRFNLERLQIKSILSLTQGFQLKTVLWVRSIPVSALVLAMEKVLINQNLQELVASPLWVNWHLHPSIQSSLDMQSPYRSQRE